MGVIAADAYPSPTIPAVNWLRAEQTTQDVLRCVQPTAAAEKTRAAIVNFVQKLLRENLGCEVFPFGSVPLKTYLPDGDIDLTAFCGPNSGGALASDVYSVLKVEEQNKSADFQVKDVQYIHAEVKLVKCLVQNIIVDISFNQIGGLCTLCFLEQIDRYFGKNHLFKQSVMLIKAWCYYESRILGAHHGLISTYALEVLILYIFFHFHSSLGGPLAVLYKFLDYFNKFDWDNYCISIYGHATLSSLPALVVEAPDNDICDLLSSKEFLKNCINMFSVPLWGSGNNLQVFPKKHLNIIDPLKENNNIGRSVSKGNSYRIRSAFAYGAKKLREILLISPQELVSAEISSYFTNILERHGKGERPDVLNVYTGCLDGSNWLGTISEFRVQNGRVKSLTPRSPTADSSGPLSERCSNIKITSVEKGFGTGAGFKKPPPHHHQAADSLHMCDMIKPDGPKEKCTVPSTSLAVDTQKFADTKASIQRNMLCEALPSSDSKLASLSGKANDSPLSFHPQSERTDQTYPIYFGTTFTRPLVPNKEANAFLLPAFGTVESSSYFIPGFPSGHGVSASAELIDGSASRSDAYVSDNSNLLDCLLRKNKGEDMNENAAISSLPNLNGNYDLHFRNLLYAQFCQGSLHGDLISPDCQSSPSQSQNTELPYSSGWYPMSAPYICGTYLVEDMFSQELASTSLSDMNSCCSMEQHPIDRAETPLLLGLPPRAPNRDCGERLLDMELLEKQSLGPFPQLQSPVLSGNTGENLGQLGRAQSQGAVTNLVSHATKLLSATKSRPSEQVIIPNLSAQEKPVLLGTCLSPSAASKRFSNFNGSESATLDLPTKLPVEKNLKPPLHLNLGGNTQGNSLQGKPQYFSSSDDFQSEDYDIQFGSLNPIQVEVLLRETGEKPNSTRPQCEGSELTLTSTLQRLDSLNHNRLTEAYQLKDDTDFPPLSMNKRVFYR